MIDDTQKLIYRYRIKLSSVDPNSRLDNKVKDSYYDDIIRSNSKRPMSIIYIDDIVGRTYLKDDRTN